MPLPSKGLQSNKWKKLLPTKIQFFKCYDRAINSYSPIEAKIQNKLKIQINMYYIATCFPCGSASKESACNAGDLDSIPGLGRSPGEGKGYPLQYSSLENSMGSPCGRKKSQTRLSDFHFQNKWSSQEYWPPIYLSAKQINVHLRIQIAPWMVSNLCAPKCLYHLCAPKCPPIFYLEKINCNKEMIFRRHQI